jgi:hypothetical protein
MNPKALSTFFRIISSAAYRSVVVILLARIAGAQYSEEIAVSIVILLGVFELIEESVYADGR